MSYPQHPDTIIVKNAFYPDGLREIDIWNYYQKIKRPFLKETLGKTLIVFFAISLNKTIVLRKNKSGELIRLNFTDYNEIISGRTLSFHTEMERDTDIGIIDIDTDNFDLAKEATRDIYDIFLKAPFIDDIKIRYTGKTSFHLILGYKRKLWVDTGRELIYDFLIKNKVDNRYTISGKRTKNIPNLDLGRNHYRAGYITLGSLSVDGLRCMNIDQRFLRNFSKDRAKFK